MAFQLNQLKCTLEYALKLKELVDWWYSEKKELIVKTSGSTGVPKEIILSRKQLIASATRSNLFFKLNEDSHAFLSLSVDTIAGKMMVFRALSGNYKLSVCNPTSDPWQFINETVFSFASFVPLQFEALKNDKILNQFKIILLGGTSLNNALEMRLRKLKAIVYIGYGMTETVSHIAVRELSTKSYSLLDGVSIKSLENGIEITDEKLGLFNLTSTDLLKFYEDNTFDYLGRNDFTINSGGIKIQVEEIEEKIRHLFEPDFVFALSALDDETLGDKLVFVSNKVLESALKTKVLEFIRNNISKYAIPKAFLLHEIKQNEQGKILRLQLRKEIFFFK